MSRTQVSSYPPPEPQVSEADEDQVVRWVGARLMGAAPQGWRRLDLVVRATSTVEEIVALAVMADGVVEIAPLPEIGSLLFELRRKCFEPGYGTWLSLRLHVEPTGSYYVHYNFTLDPLWDPPLPNDLYEADQAVFPRAEPWFPGRPITATGNDLLRDAANYLKFALPAGWEYVQLQYRGIGDHEEAGALVHSMGGTFPWTPPKQVLELLRRHRAGAARPGAGTWLNLWFEMRFPESVNIRFNSLDDPGYLGSPGAGEFAEELRRYPRAEEYIPGWLTERAAGR